MIPQLIKICDDGRFCHFQVPAFELLMKVLAELPSITGKFVKNITSNVAGRNMVFLPLTKRAILQYCTKFLVKTLKVIKNSSFQLSPN